MTITFCILQYFEDMEDDMMKDQQKVKTLIRICSEESDENRL